MVPYNNKALALPFSLWEKVLVGQMRVNLINGTFKGTLTRPSVTLSRCKRGRKKFKKIEADDNALLNLTFKITFPHARVHVHDCSFHHAHVLALLA